MQTRKEFITATVHVLDARASFMRHYNVEAQRLLIPARGALHADLVHVFYIITPDLSMDGGFVRITPGTKWLGLTVELVPLVDQRTYFTLATDDDSFTQVTLLDAKPVAQQR